MSMHALEQDKYVRQTAGYLPEAELAFVDEVGPHCAISCQSAEG